MRRIGTSPGGIPIYQFRYKNDPEARIYQGVLAQDLLETHPHAVHLNADGFYSVNYRLIDVRFFQVKGRRSVKDPAPASVAARPASTD